MSIYIMLWFLGVNVLSAWTQLESTSVTQVFVEPSELSSDSLSQQELSIEKDRTSWTSSSSPSMTSDEMMASASSPIPSALRALRIPSFRSRRLMNLTIMNRTEARQLAKRSQRGFPGNTPFSRDDLGNWADESAPPFMGGLSFPLFAPNLGGVVDPFRAGLVASRRPLPPSLDYDRSGPVGASDPLSRLPTSDNYYDSGKDRPPVRGSSVSYTPEVGRRYRDKKYPVGPYSSSSTPPASGTKAGRPKPTSSNQGTYGHTDPFYPDYSEDGVPRYSYNPMETPKCAKEANVSYCIDDAEYPIETMQYEIDRDASILDQIMPESEDKMELVEGIPKKDDEKYNFRHYFTYRIDELENQTRSSQKDQVTFGLKPDYYKDGGYICPSSVHYVQPRRARNIDGLWKVILNLRERYKGLDYKQSVRLEQCMHSGRECSFTSAFYNSQCIQKYNNVRLLAWTEEKGIHLDIFRLPIACSCHFRGKTNVKNLNLA